LRVLTSVLLPYVYKGSIPKDNPTVMWTCSDLNPKSVHLQGKGGDDLKGQNQRYSGRTSMSRYALNTKDFSLTLRKPKLTDSGIYTCSISAGGEEHRLSDIQLHVKVKGLFVCLFICFLVPETLSTFQQLLHHGGRSLTVTGEEERFQAMSTCAWVFFGLSST
uniref:Immunoglobulin V-set domain-containing protein n=1 Tax=Pundamilia nyererei TaxID=303518 RepID=A0A3B4FYF0_9CICH